MSDILLLSSYETLDAEFRPLIKEISPNYSFSMTKYRQHGTESEKVLSNVDDETKVIITRGYPATVCRRYTNSHVVEIGVSFQDLLRSINDILRKKLRRIAIIAYSNIFDELNNAVHYCDAELFFLTLSDRPNDRQNIIRFIERNRIDAVIGSAFPHEIAKELGIPSIMIRSSLESMRKALQEAVLFIDNQRAQNQKDQRIRRQLMEKGWVANSTFTDILGDSPAIQDCIHYAKRWATSNKNLLITGSTGTGKSIFAESIHNEGPRFNKPFIEINCATLPDHILESEFFGYEEGYHNGNFTKGKQGLLDAANGGTLFLDGIGDASLKMQSIILDIIEGGKYKKIGGDTYYDIDIRTICSTNRNLPALIEDKRFMRRLYYRINELELNLPDLAKRGDDLIQLAKHFIENAFYKEYNRRVRLAPGSMKLLSSYNWPGNIRELSNFSSKFAYHCDGQTPDKQMIDSYFSYVYLGNHNREKDFLRVEFARDEKELLRNLYRNLLLHYNGDKKQLCDDFGISRSTLWRKINGK